MAGTERRGSGLQPLDLWRPGAITLTYLVTSFKVTAVNSGLSAGISGRLVAEMVLIGAVRWMAMNALDEYEIQQWLWEM